MRTNDQIRQAYRELIKNTLKSTEGVIGAKMVRELIEAKIHHMADDRIKELVWGVFEHYTFDEFIQLLRVVVEENNIQMQPPPPQKKQEKKSFIKKEYKN